MTLADYWYDIRHWLASKLMGFNILDEVDEAYEAGFFAGKSGRFSN